MSDPLQLDALESHERLALGGLIRILIRADGSFSEEEEEVINRVGDALGGQGALWSVISSSAQHHKNDEAIRGDVTKVVRPEVRALIRTALDHIARAETIEPGEQKLLDWLDETWSE